MQILLSCAKDMTDRCSLPSDISFSHPRFMVQAKELALMLMNYDEDELASILKINSKLAALNRIRYRAFLEEDNLLPAIFAYTGMAYRHFQASSLTSQELKDSQQHLWLTSFLYGLLRPLDLIKGHRLEGNVRLAEKGDITVFEYWRPLLTDVLLGSIQQDDGILLNVASEEMKSLFDWKRIEREVCVIEPQFLVKKNGKERTIVVYAKMCRGAMARWAIQNKPQKIAHLAAFEHEDFRYAHHTDLQTLSSQDKGTHKLRFVLTAE